MSSTESAAPGAYRNLHRSRRLDVAAIHAYLTRSYWSPGIPIGIVERALRHSLCFGVYESAGGAQVGLARVVTDYATFAYLCDVYVLEEHRGSRPGEAHDARADGAPRPDAALDASCSRRATRMACTPGSDFMEAGAAKNLMEIVRPDIYAARTDTGYS